MVRHSRRAPAPAGSGVAELLDAHYQSAHRRTSSSGVLEIDLASAERTRGTPTPSTQTCAPLQGEVAVDESPQVYRDLPVVVPPLRFIIWRNHGRDPVWHSSPATMQDLFVLAGAATTSVKCIFTTTPSTADSQPSTAPRPVALDSPQGRNRILDAFFGRSLPES